MKLDDQSWFWSKDWQSGEEEATMDIQTEQLSKKLHNANEIRDYLVDLSTR